jgi:hypothetical protein
MLLLQGTCPNLKKLHALGDTWAQASRAAILALQPGQFSDLAAHYNTVNEDGARPPIVTLPKFEIITQSTYGSVASGKHATLGHDFFHFTACPSNVTSAENAARVALLKDPENIQLYARQAYRIMRPEGRFAFKVIQEAFPLCVREDEWPATLGWTDKLLKSFPGDPSTMTPQEQVELLIYIVINGSYDGTFCEQIKAMTKLLSPHIMCATDVAACAKAMDVVTDPAKKHKPAVLQALEKANCAKHSGVVLTWELPLDLDIEAYIKSTRARIFFNNKRDNQSQIQLNRDAHGGCTHKSSVFEKYPTEQITIPTDARDVEITVTLYNRCGVTGPVPYQVTLTGPGGVIETVHDMRFKSQDTKSSRQFVCTVNPGVEPRKERTAAPEIISDSLARKLVAENADWLKCIGVDEQRTECITTQSMVSKGDGIYFQGTTTLSDKDNVIRVDELEGQGPQNGGGAPGGAPATALQAAIGSNSIMLQLSAMKLSVAKGIKSAHPDGADKKKKQTKKNFRTPLGSTKLPTTMSELLRYVQQNGITSIKMSPASHVPAAILQINHGTSLHRSQGIVFCEFPMLNQVSTPLAEVEHKRATSRFTRDWFTSVSDSFGTVSNPRKVSLVSAGPTVKNPFFFSFTESILPSSEKWSNIGGGFFPADLVKEVRHKTRFAAQHYTVRPTMVVGEDMCIGMSPVAGSNIDVWYGANDTKISVFV